MIPQKTVMTVRALVRQAWVLTILTIIYQLILTTPANAPSRNISRRENRIRPRVLTVETCSGARLVADVSPAASNQGGSLKLLALPACLAFASAEAVPLRPLKA